MHLLGEIEKYLKASGMSASRFGREVAGDPRFVHDMRRGRQSRARMADKVAAYLRAHIAPEVQ